MGGPVLLQALNSAGHLPGYKAGPHVVPPPVYTWLLDALSHTAGVCVWHLCTDELHVENIFTLLRGMQAAGSCSTFCRLSMALVSGNDPEVLAKRLEHELPMYHSATIVTMVFLAPYAAKGYSTILV